MLRTIWRKGNGRGIWGFAVNRGAVNRGFTVEGSKVCNMNVLQSKFNLIASYILRFQNVQFRLPG